MSRFSFTLTAQPIEIQNAVRNLEKPRREAPPLRIAYVDFVKELPKIPPDALQKMKLKKSAQEMIPYALIDAQEDEVLKKAIIRLLEEKFAGIAAKTKIRILCAGIDVPEFRRLGYTFFSTQPPMENTPRWIRDYWKDVLRPEDPIANLVRILQQNSISIIDAIAWLGIDPCARCVDAIWERYVSIHDHHLLKTNQYSDVLDFLRSSAPNDVRSRILIWVLNTYAQIWEPQDVPLAYRQLLDIGVTLWGTPKRGGWQECAPSIWAMFPT